MITNLANEFNAVHTVPEISPTLDGYDFTSHERPDYVFISTDDLPEHIQDIGEKARQRNPLVRIVLLDSTETFNKCPYKLGAHSLARTTHETIPVIARYWSNCLSPP